MTVEERREMIRKHRSEGLNDVQIAGILGVSPSLIGQDRRAMGIPALAPGGPAVLVTIEQLRGWRDAGLTVKQMAELCPASPKTISKKLWEMRLMDERAVQPVEDEEDDEPVPEIIGDDLFLSAFAAASVALPDNSRRAEVSDRYGRMFLPPVEMSAPSSLCMGG